MAATSRKPNPKLCPRCGAFYQDLPSQICPQCFGRLDPLSDEDAADMIAEQDRRAQDPVLTAERRIDDERFNEQSFGACLGIAATLAALAAVSIALVVIAAHRHVRAPVAPIGAAAPVERSSLPADFDRIVPTVAGADGRTAADDNLALPGSATRIYHGIYVGGGQIFAVGQIDPSADQIAMLALAADAAAAQHHPTLLQERVETGTGTEIVVAPDMAQLTSMARTLTRRNMP